MPVHQETQEDKAHWRARATLATGGGAGAESNLEHVLYERFNCKAGHRVTAYQMSDGGRSRQPRVLDIMADYGIGGDYVTCLLDRAATFRGYPKQVRIDNVPEFTCWAFMTWAQKHVIKHIRIEPGSPTQNAYIESLNGTSGMNAWTRTGLNNWYKPN